jgi:nicotinamidase-related amidase
VTDDATLADLLELVLSGRPERLQDIAVARLPDDMRAAVGAVSDTVGLLGLAEHPSMPTPELRERILTTVRARLARSTRRALLVCDMINDHLVPGRLLEVPRARDIVPALIKRIEDARAANVPIVYVLDRHEEGDPELEEWGTHAVAGTEGADVWPPLAPKPGDRVVAKASYSGFHQSELESVLEELAVDTVVLTGCATEVQLMTTATDALQRGFAVEMPADSQAGNSLEGETFAMQVLSALIPYAPARKARLERIKARAA